MVKKKQSSNSKKSKSTKSKGKKASTKARIGTSRVSKAVKSTPLSKWLKNTYYAVWSVVGLALIIAAIAALLGNGTVVDNLKITGTQSEAQQQTQAPQQQQPPQPTEEQLNCIADELGEERLSELEQGDASTQKEAVVIQECLQG